MKYDREPMKVAEVAGEMVAGWLSEVYDVSLVECCEDHYELLLLRRDGSVGLRLRKEFCAQLLSALRKVGDGSAGGAGA